ncbi:MAG: STAS domain-containing protein [Pseudomonadota bacterium]
MELTTIKDGEVFIFSVTGRLDAETAQKAEKEAKTWLAKGEKKIAGDLTGLAYISSAGLRLMLMLAKGLKTSGGKFCLFGLQEPVMEVFEIAGFSSIIPLAPSKGDALVQLGG